VEKISWSISDIDTFMNSIPMFSSKGLSAANFNLARMTEFCRIMGNPQDDFKSVHVAGTNGKGTVCRMLASVYQSAGYKTGLYTSPHLIDFRERFIMNGRLIGETDLIQFFKKYGGHIRNNKYTYFEITTAIAFWYFSNREVDIAIIETGLGGRLDATNVISPEISVITSIGLDHTDLLGDSVESIAGEKGGIIKKETPVVTGYLPDKAHNVIQQIADKLHSELISVNQFNPGHKNGNISLNDGDKTIVIDALYLKKIDAINTAISFAVIKNLHSVLYVDIKDFISGIDQMTERFTRRGVFEKLTHAHNWYFDGAHNEEAIRCLVEHLVEIAPENRWTVVLSFMKDKLSHEVVRQWRRFSNIKITGMNTERAATVSEMKECFPDASEVKLDEIFNKNQFETELVIFSGSFYFYNVVRKWMGTVLATEENLSALEE
jgi:dihydrofolate synthase / folylpolyglutamate synthase